MVDISALKYVHMLSCLCRTYASIYAMYDVMNFSVQILYVLKNVHTLIIWKNF